MPRAIVARMCCCRRLPREMLAAVEGTRECFPKPEYTATGDVGRRYAAKGHHTTIIRAEVPGPPYVPWYRGAFPLLLEVSQVYCFSSSLALEATEQLRSSSYCFSSFSSSLARYAIRAPRLPAHDPYFRISDSPYWPWCRAGHPPRRTMKRYGHEKHGRKLDTATCLAERAPRPLRGREPPAH